MANSQLLKKRMVDSKQFRANQQKRMPFLETAQEIGTEIVDKNKTIWSTQNFVAQCNRMNVYVIQIICAAMSQKVHHFVQELKVTAATHFPLM